MDQINQKEFNKLEEEKEQENYKCECNEFYSNQIFDNKCSMCFYNKNPSKYYQIMNLEPKKFHTDSFLQNYTYKYRINDTSNLYKLLENIISDDYNFKIQDLLLLINHIKTKTNFKGISCTQAVKLYKKYINYHTNKTKLQHILSGLVIDWWNLNKYKNTLGAIVCYYDNDTYDGKRIRYLEYGKEIRLCPAFSDIPEDKIFWISTISKKK